MGKGEREVEVKTLRTVVIPVRSGKAGAKSVRFKDLTDGIALARGYNGEVMFDVPGEDSPVDVGLKLKLNGNEKKAEPEISNAGIPKTE